MGETPRPTVNPADFPPGTSKEALLAIEAMLRATYDALVAAENEKAAGVG